MAFWGFSSLNFVTDRYLLCMLPFVMVGCVALVHALLLHRSRAVPIGFLAIAAALFAKGIGNQHKVGDTFLAYADGIDVHRRLVAYCETKGLQDSEIAGSFMDVFYLNDTLAGYCSSPDAFTHLSNGVNSNSRYVILAYDHPPEERAFIAQQGFALLERFEYGDAWVELHERSKQ
jgi:hypothetical protein